MTLQFLKTRWGLSSSCQISTWRNFKWTGLFLRCLGTCVPVHSHSQSIDSSSPAPFRFFSLSAQTTERLNANHEYLPPKKSLSPNSRLKYQQQDRQHTPPKNLVHKVIMKCVTNVSMGQTRFSVKRESIRVVCYKSHRRPNSARLRERASSTTYGARSRSRLIQAS